MNQPPANLKGYPVSSEAARPWPWVLNVGRPRADVVERALQNRIGVPAGRPEVGPVAAERVGGEVAIAFSAGPRESQRCSFCLEDHAGHFAGTYHAQSSAALQPGCESRQELTSDAHP
jgi:hypothetical protein